MKNPIRELWDKGYGSGSIAIVLKIPHRQVFQYLKEHGLKRTASEARELRKKTGVPYYVREKKEPVFKQVVKKTREPKMSIYDSIVTTDSALIGNDVERALNVRKNVKK